MGFPFLIDPVDASDDIGGKPCRVRSRLLHAPPPGRQLARRWWPQRPFVPQAESVMRGHPYAGCCWSALPRLRLRPRAQRDASDVQAGEFLQC
jgi:hypothetical protein